MEELRARRRLAGAVTKMRAAIDEVNSSSVLVEIEPSAFDNFASHELPSADSWTKKVHDVTEKARAKHFSIARERPEPHPV